MTGCAKTKRVVDLNEVGVIIAKYAFVFLAGMVFGFYLYAVEVPKMIRVPVTEMQTHAW